MRSDTSFVTASAFTVVLLTACGERQTMVRLEGGSQPTFVLSGSGDLGELRIYGPRQRSVGSDLDYVVWEIEAMGGQNEGRPVERLRRIQYGLVPEAYKQKFPEYATTAPPLEPGERYEYWFITTDAPHARGYFEVRDGKAVVVAGE